MVLSVSRQISWRCAPDVPRSTMGAGRAQYSDRMLRLVADTCVWLDLAKTVNGEPLIAACRQLIEEERLELLVPQLVIDECERNRGRIEADMARSVSATFHRVRAAVDEHGRGDGRDEALKQFRRIAWRSRVQSWSCSKAIWLRATHR